MKVLVIGATGNVGTAVVAELCKREAEVCALVRKQNAATSQFSAGVEVVVGDLLDPVSVEKALHGVNKLYLLNAVVPDELTQGNETETPAYRLSLGLPRGALQGCSTLCFEACYRRGTTGVRAAVHDHSANNRRANDRFDPAFNNSAVLKE
jgi:hypothetical protein